MLARVGDPLVDDLAPIDAVGEQMIERAAPERAAAFMGAAGPLLDLGAVPVAGELLDQFAGRAKGDVAAQDVTDQFGFAFIDDELTVADVIAERDGISHPQALLLRGGDLVADDDEADPALALDTPQLVIARAVDLRR